MVMLRRYRWALWTAALLVIVPAPAADKNDKKKDADAKTQATPEEVKQVMQTGKMTGRVASSGTGSLTLEVDFPHLEPNANLGKGVQNPGRELQAAMRYQQDVAKKEAEILRARNPAERARRLQQLVMEVQKYQMHNHPQHLAVHVVNNTKTYDLPVADDAKVRTLQLPEEKDDKGNPKKYTAKELADLKGPNSNLPGYTSDISNVQSGQTVEVTFGRRSTADKDKDNKEDKDKPATEMQVTMVVIQKSADAPDVAANPKKK
jgi:hypothetical protein